MTQQWLEFSTKKKMMNPSVTPLFPVKGTWVLCVPTKATIFCVGSSLGQDFNFGQSPKKGVTPPQLLKSLGP